ncbi:MAG: alkaline phosphatase family protein [Povalibacter sp.]
MKRTALTLSCFFCIGSTLAAPATAPKLLVTVVVDQYSADLFTEYRPLYKEGLAQLANGVVFPRGHQSHAATETCPGHSTILTGARPARTGIIANDWQDPSLSRTNNGNETFTIYCAEKPGAAGSDARKQVISPDALRVPTLGDRMKAVDSKARVVAVSGKDRSAVMLGGHNADLTLWWTNAGFVTYADQTSRVPASINGKINDAFRASYKKGMTASLPRECASRSHASKITDDFSVGTLQAIKPESRRWRASPALDSFTVDVALAALDELQLGRRDTTDLLAISLAGTDYVGHYFGTEGAEMCAQQVALDHVIGRVLSELTKRNISFAVVLTADHGGVDVTERNLERGVAAQRMDTALLPQNMNAALAKELGTKGPLLLGSDEFTSDVYLSPKVSSAQRTLVLDAARRLYEGHPQVAAVFSKNEMIAAERPTGTVDEWSLLERAKASFDPQRSGDLIVLLKPYINIYHLPKNSETDYVTTHGSPWGYDRRVPIIFWWPGIQGFEQPTPIETVDIAPTLAQLIGLKIPADEIDGHALEIERK